MPVNKKYIAVFEFDKIYHIYNKTNNRELLFRTNENYYYFLRQYNQYISPIVETFAWNLLPNHFHFIIREKPQAAITSWLTELTIEKRTKTEQHFLPDQDINKLVEMTFKRFFISYAMAFNLMFKRTGNLFYRTFNRVEILKDSHFTQAIICVHANAQKHQFVGDFSAYPWISYHSILSNKPTKLSINEVLEWFGGMEQFKTVHKGMTDYYYNFSGAIEDDDQHLANVKCPVRKITPIV